MTERKIKVDLDNSSLSIGLCLLVIFLVIGGDMTNKKPGTLGKAIGCRIGGPAFCPPTPPVRP